MTSFSVKDPGLALAPKMGPDQSQAFKEGNSNHAFTVGIFFYAFFFFFLTGHFQVLQSMFFTNFQANIQRNDCAGPIVRI